METWATLLESRLVSRFHYKADDAAAAVGELARLESWLLEPVRTADDSTLASRYVALESWALKRGIALSDLLGEGGSDDGPTFEEFSEAREKLLQQLRAFGTHDAFGNGDYFLVDSRTPSWSMLLEVQRPSVFDEESLNRLSCYVEESLPGWQLVVRVDESEEDIILPLGTVPPNDRFAAPR